LLAALVCCALAAGCVQRRFTIRSNPPGAAVYVDNHPIGTTPVSHDFIYYGTRDVRLVKDGYETLNVKTKMPTPWYELPGIDFFSENLWPSEIRDNRVLDFQLQPQMIVPTEQLIGRAEELRRIRGPQATIPAGAVGVVEPTPPTSQPGTIVAPPTLSPPAQGTATELPPPREISPARPGIPMGPPPSTAPLGPPGVAPPNY
jgi:hypothetical protein